MKKNIPVILPHILCLIFAALPLLNSCLGVSADITIRADGSGSIALEYRVSQMLESLGRLDGNERWPTIPVGRADFERSIARIPGLRLSSFSTKEIRSANGGIMGAYDLVTKAVLEFNDIAALLAFLDAGGSRAYLVQENGKNLLRLVLLDPSEKINDADLISLLQEVSAGYEINLSLSTPKNAGLAVIPPSIPAARVVTQGKKVSFAVGTGELLNLKDGLAIEIAW